MLDLSAIRAEVAKDLEVEAKAAPGPWELDWRGIWVAKGGGDKNHSETSSSTLGVGGLVCQPWFTAWERNGQLLHHARNTLRSRCETMLAMADEIERLREELRKQPTAEIDGQLTPLLKKIMTETKEDLAQ